MFGTSGIRGEVGVEVTADLALAVGRALASEGYGRVVVGRDTRESGSLLADALSAGLRDCGGDVLRVGVATSPTVARAVEWLDADAGVTITASHNPAKDNGIKLWSQSGQAFDTERRAAIVERLERERFDSAGWRDLGNEREVDVVDRHRAELVDSLSLASTLSVVVDAANGPGVLTAKVLDDAGCEVTTLNGQQDGSFPGRPSEPTPDNCRVLRSMVAEIDADLGIAHDGDADRMLAVTEDGQFVSGDALLALFGRDVAGVGDRVAAPLNTSLAVDDALETVGASVTRTRVGDVYVAERLREPDVVFGGEPSGAWIWGTEPLCPDGPFAACRVVELVDGGDPLGEQVSALPEYPMTRDSIEVADRDATMRRVARRVDDAYQNVQSLDGVHVDTGDGWFLVRASGTQPLVRITAEARTEERTDELFGRATDLVRGVVETV
ncbi:MAG: phosphoglucosamine mutase [Halobacteriota archaeon]